jgi:hypothetical protein
MSMKTWAAALAILAAVALAAAPARAQQDPASGITLGYRGGIGVLWHISDGFALRPDFAFSKSLTQQVTETWTATAGLSALFYLSRRDALRTFVSPRIGYTRSEAQSYGPQAVTWSGSASFGAEYALARRFGVFAEAGLQYSTMTVANAAVNGQLVPFAGAKPRSLGTTSGLGVLLFF